MKPVHLVPHLLPFLVLAACAEDQVPTAPPPIEPGAASFLQAAGHKVVNSLADPGDGTCNPKECTLREAVNDPTSTEISFAAGIAGTITLAPPAAGGGQLRIGKPLTITGPGTGITIRRRDTDPAFRFVRIDAGVTATLTNLAVRNGRTNGSGGGIINLGTLTLVRTVVAGNAAAVQGGGIYSSGGLSLTNSVVAGNTGNGIDNRGSLTLVRTRVANNGGAGIANHDDATLSLTNSTVARNSSVGIANDGGRLTLTGGRIERNASGGVSAVRGNSTISDVRIADNSTAFNGGGIFAFNALLTLTNSTIARNSAAQDGGGIASRTAAGSPSPVPRLWGTRPGTRVAASSTECRFAPPPRSRWRTARSRATRRALAGASTTWVPRAKPRSRS